MWSTNHENRCKQFCERHSIRKLCLFGSVLRDDFTTESDVDVLVEFETGKTPGLAIITMEDELSNIINRQKDRNREQFSILSSVEPMMISDRSPRFL
ncbi:nucleotidyltransferase family protein [Okeania sp. SIO2B3]|uniref:nucleotidyltransferase family protein n=1 Tax=Okeania sp. SIO2B3 TaxID=2607784 RepID=UPI0013BECBBA|nr:nucleotidyltransferase domain-containing protein [Okeania sp. SIO2B3]NET46390.1 hypothetical protein [Okeania sp. SIO2B3]